MKILHTVESYHPAINGMQEVVQQLSERLVKLGHDVTVATSSHPERTKHLVNGVRIVEFNISGNMVSGYHGDFHEYQEFLVNSHFDVITNFAAQQWATDLALPILDRISAKKVLVPTGFSGLYLPQFQDYYTKMKTWMGQYDFIIFLSNNYRDINFARQNCIAKFIVIPNGAAADEFLHPPGINLRQKLGIAAEHFLILHVGNHTGVKGHAEAMEILDKLNISKVTLLIIGKLPAGGGGCTQSCLNASKSFNETHTGKKILVQELTREETIAAYHEADLFLFCSWIECSPLVLFEAMASKTPFLTTDVGNAKEIILWSNGGILLPTTKDSGDYSRVEVDHSARILEELISNPTKRESLANAGFQAWKKAFTWEKITAQYERTYQMLLG